jgi:ADP-heptose:LPS heptosyltransferase
MPGNPSLPGNPNLKSVELIGKYYLGTGGIGDALIFLSTFYDEVEEANVIFLANNTASIQELFNYFPKIKKKLIIQSDFTWLKEFYHHQNCIGTGIIPKNLDYSTWYKIDIFKEYGVKEFPDFINLFEPIKIDPKKKQIFIQSEGSCVEGPQKKRILGKIGFEEAQKYLQKGWQFAGCDDTAHLEAALKSNNNPKSLKQIIQEIRGSDLVISVDSFAKTVSAMSKIKTIVYDNVYDPEYLKRFKDGIDYGHYVFLFPWSYIELRDQNNDHKTTI